MTKILSVVGARPQFVKAAVVSKALGDVSCLSEISVHTGQHYDPKMSSVFFDELRIPTPTFQLRCGGGSHAIQTAKMLSELEPIFLTVRPDIVLVYGDTNSTLAAALTAAKLDIPVAHVEAGLRSYNRTMPEEVNRVLTDHLSSILFAPTENAMTLLRNEGIVGDSVHRVGDVMQDAAIFFSPVAMAESQVLHDFQLTESSFVLATVHRAENTDNESHLRSILEGLNALGKKIPVVLPLHPRTRLAIHRINSSAQEFPSIQFVEPVGYLDMLVLESSAVLIVTDSGGVQKEAFFASVPCITLRTETEWTELIDAGWNRLVSPGDAIELPDIFDEWVIARRRPADELNPFGQGRASELIADRLSRST